jgi:MFS transporter, DHA1 family, multidrug resistance protein
MFIGMGIQYAGTLLGCVAILLIPIPVCFYLYGKKLRERSKYSPTMGDKPPLDEESETDEVEQDGASEVLRETSTTTTNGAGVDVEKKA